MVKKESGAMEAETLLSMKTYFMEKLLASSFDLPTDIYFLRSVESAAKKLPHYLKVIETLGIHHIYSGAISTRSFKNVRYNLT
jgi:hypothetical protein